MTTAATRSIPAIEDYGVIGDCRSAALISKRGALDWLCWPRFDSPSIFGALLDAEKGGTWEICPTDVFESSRRYIDQTNVLETRFQTEHGTAVLTDFMPVATEEYKRTHLCPDHELIRMVRCESGEIAIRATFAPRMNYGKQKPDIVNKGKLGLRVNIGRGLLTLYSDVRFDVDEDQATAVVHLTAGQTHAFSLTYAFEAPEVLPALDHADSALVRTVDWWKAWAAQCTYKGPHASAVQRSALALKLLSFSSSGAFVAAVTTSLPEKIGGELNWDYRFCWLRDASLAVEAFCGTGYIAEAEAFSEWMLHATRLTQPKLMVLYDVYGNMAQAEKKLTHLTGYKNSAPVQIGNMARNQLQLDVYGEVISGAARIIRQTGQIDGETARVLVGFGRYVCKHWSEPDAGIWEPRSEPVVHTHSQLLCWLALNDLLDLEAKGFIKKLPHDLFEKTRAEIRQSIETKSWKEEFSSYSSEQHKMEVDATLLRLAMHGFEPATSDRISKTYERVQEKLQAGPALLYRNRDTSEPKEGAFAICSFWAIEFLAMRGDLKVAKHNFEVLLSKANELGLYSEEIDPLTGAALGNFPQAFTHIGLINAALAIEKGEQTV